MTLLAQIATLNRQPDAALAWLRRALTADPYDSEAGRLLESLARGGGGPGARPAQE